LMLYSQEIPALAPSIFTTRRRCRNVLDENPEDIPVSKEETPKLKQEMMNIPFI